MKNLRPGLWMLSIAAPDVFDLLVLGGLMLLMRYQCRQDRA